MPSSSLPLQTLSPRHIPAQTAAQRGNVHLSYGHYNVQLRYTLKNQTLSLRGILNSDTLGVFANDYHLVLYAANGWVADFIKIPSTGRFSFSPPHKNFYSVTLRVAGEEYLLGALEL